MTLKLILNIEGLDGSGKNTITSLLFPDRERVLQMSFPEYSSATGNLVKKFLKGDIMDPKIADPITSSLFYTIDRRRALAMLAEAKTSLLSNYDVILFDRSFMSNYFYQAMKYALDKNGEITHNSFTSAWRELLRFQQLMRDLEISSTVLNDYRDTMINIVLYHPNVETNIKLMNRRGGKRDLYEKDELFLKTVNDFTKIAYSHQHKLLDEYKFEMIQCSDDDGVLFSPDKIVEDIASLIQNKVDEWDIG